jgi:hypothetical protein
MPGYGFVQEPTGEYYTRIFNCIASVAATINRFAMTDKMPAWDSPEASFTGTIDGHNHNDQDFYDRVVDAAAELRKSWATEPKNVLSPEPA